MVISSPCLTDIKNWLVQSKRLLLASPKQTALGKDFSNPLIVDSLLKTIWLSMHHVVTMKHWLFQSKRLLVFKKLKLKKHEVNLDLSRLANTLNRLERSIQIGINTLVVGKVLELIMEDGPRCGLHLNVDKTKVFWPKEDPRSRLVGVFPPTIARPLHGVKLLGGPVSVDSDFSSGLVLKRVAKSIKFMDVIAKLNDPQCELLLLRTCAGISKLYFAMRTCSPQVFELAQHSFDAALRSSLERIVTASGPGFGDWQWRLATLPFSYGGARCLLCSALNAFNVKMEIDHLSNPSEIATPKLMKKLADIYFTSVTQMAESTFSLSTRQMALWKSQMEDHTSDWLRVVPIIGLGQTMNGRTYRCVLGYRLGVPLFLASKPCSACSWIFMGDIYGDHAVSCAGIVGIKHRHNVVRDTLVDISDVLLYSWDVRRDVCVDLIGSSPLTQTGMVNFVPGRAVTEATQRKRVKYEAKCADIGYGFLPFSFSSFGELKKDAVTLLKRIWKFSMAQDIRARAVVHIFNRISGPVSMDAGFRSALVMKRVSKTIELLNAVAKINDPQCELLLIRACAGVSKLYFAMRACPPRVFESARLAFDMALCSALERIVTASGPGFGDWQ
ncbi:hypothetical protein Tco_0766209 [Tanacetum coccineum]